MARVAIALGSNLGDRAGHIHWAVGELAKHLQNSRVSDLIETDPVGVPDPQPCYMNAVLVGDTDLTARAVMDLLASLEQARGRLRTGFRAARTLDLDLILYDEAVIATDGLTIPHPRFRERLFVLAPLVSLEPDWVDPVTGRTVAELLRRLEASGGPGAHSHPRTPGP